MYQQITGSSFPLVDLMDIEKEYNGDIYQNSLDEEQQRNSVKFQKLRYGKEYVKITKLTEEILRKYKKIVVAEMNTGQFAGYLKSKFEGIKLHRYNEIKGQPFNVSALVEAFTKIMEE